MFLKCSAKYFFCVQMSTMIEIHKLTVCDFCLCSVYRRQMFMLQCRAISWDHESYLKVWKSIGVGHKISIISITTFQLSHNIQKYPKSYLELPANRSDVLWYSQTPRQVLLARIYICAEGNMWITSYGKNNSSRLEVFSPTLKCSSSLVF